MVEEQPQQQVKYPEYYRPIIPATHQAAIFSRRSVPSLAKKYLAVVPFLLGAYPLTVTASSLALVCLCSGLAASHLLRQYYSRRYERIVKQLIVTADKRYKFVLYPSAVKHFGRQELTVDWEEVLHWRHYEELGILEAELRYDRTKGLFQTLQLDLSLNQATEYKQYLQELKKENHVVL